MIRCSVGLALVLSAVMLLVVSGEVVSGGCGPGEQCLGLPLPPPFPDISELFHDTLIAIGKESLLSVVVDSLAVSNGSSCCAMKVNFTDLNSRLNSSDPVDLHEICFPPDTTTPPPPTTTPEIETTSSRWTTRPATTVHTSTSATSTGPPTTTSNRTRPDDKLTLTTLHRPGVETSASSTPVAMTTTRQEQTTVPSSQTTSTSVVSETPASPETPRQGAVSARTNDNVMTKRQVILAAVLGTVLPIIAIIIIIVIVVLVRRSDRRSCIEILKPTHHHYRLNEQQSVDANRNDVSQNPAAVPASNGHAKKQARRAEPSRQSSTSSQLPLVGRSDSQVSYDGSVIASGSPPFIQLETISESTTDFGVEPVEVSATTLPRVGPSTDQPEVLMMPSRLTDPMPRRADPGFMNGAFVEEPPETGRKNTMKAFSDMVNIFDVAIAEADKADSGIDDSTLERRMSRPEAASPLDDGIGSEVDVIVQSGDVRAEGSTLDI